MKTNPEKTIVVHDDPAWGDLANFIIFADLSNFGMPDHWEQLWTKQIRDDEFLICCIPFFTYGIALGDQVHTVAAHKRKYVFSTVVKPGGHQVVRVWLRHINHAVRLQIGTFVLNESLLYEAGSPDLLAIDLPGDAAKQQRVLGFLEDMQRKEGILLEMG
jgi:Domain of unknown function (DUF4265)